MATSLGFTVPIPHERVEDCANYSHYRGDFTAWWGPRFSSFFGSGPAPTPELPLDWNDTES